MTTPAKALRAAGFTCITSGEGIWRRGATTGAEFIIEAMPDLNRTPSQPLTWSSLMLCEGTEAKQLGLANRVLPVGQLIAVVTADTPADKETDNDNG